MKKFAYLLLPALIISLCGCSSSAPAAQSSVQPSEEETETETAEEEQTSSETETEETAAEPETEETSSEEEQTPEPVEIVEEEEVGIPLFGTYTLYSVEMNGVTVDPAEASVSASFQLNEDYTGSLIVNDSEAPIPNWEEDNGKITLYNENGDPLECEVLDGIMTIEMGDNYYWYLAHEATGITADSSKSKDSLIYAVCEKIDANAGAHLSYEYHSDYMDSTSVFDVHAKDGILYSAKTVKVSGAEGLTVTFFKDGTAYVLDPDDMTGMVATTTSSGIAQDNVLLLDDLYQEIYMMSKRGNYETETREVDGTEYQVEVFPATDYSPETAFYFDADGTLVHVLRGAPVSMPDLGERFYTIHSIDTDVDESLFDISGYEITE